MRWVEMSMRVQRRWGEYLEEIFSDYVVKEADYYFYNGFNSFDKTNDFEGLGHKIFGPLQGNLFSNFHYGKLSNLIIETKGEGLLKGLSGKVLGVITESLSGARIVNLDLTADISAREQIDSGYEDSIKFLSDVSPFGSASNSKVYFTKSKVTIDGNSNLGGFFSSATNCLISNCISSGTIDGVFNAYTS